MTVAQLARKVAELTGSRSEVVFKPLPEDDPRVRQPDITLARQRLGWQPDVPLEEGLRQTIRYFREAPGA
jgi:nucleoside-diphosphate-sugar epimerase